jgi:GNAT superfamily N-acetyltransferase
MPMRELGAADVAELQRFFDANPEYFQAVNGEAPRTDEAQQELDDLPPAGMPFGRRWSLGYVDDGGALVGMATVVSDFIADRVWHVGLFIVASALHGSGSASTLYDELERWMRGQGARWLRLGVVAGNTKAERFWQKVGYVELRERGPLAMGQRTNIIRVLWKPLTGGSVDDYLARVERDRPGAA